jgi:hypothetical protein
MAELFAISRRVPEKVETGTGTPLPFCEARPVAILRVSAVVQLRRNIAGSCPMPIRSLIRALTVAGILAIGSSSAQINDRSIFAPPAEPASFAAFADVPEPEFNALLGAGLLALAAIRRPR